ncbi:(2Fe-2S)-binding protein [Actinoplanes sp. NPDC023936]|uniref:(2Fe-2S)-binding protein n=1 Tax=Actinoplanes sp. NPDC023936 TaxID=3154910 RepID=UPI0033C357B6
MAELIDATPALEAAARFGPYCTWETQHRTWETQHRTWETQHRARETRRCTSETQHRTPETQRPIDGTWPLTDLQDPGVLADRVDSASHLLAAMAGLTPDELPKRAVASTVFLGLAARLVSPPLAAAVTSGAVPIPDPARMRWRPVASGPIPIFCDGLPATTDDLVTALNTVIEILVEPVLDVFRTQFVLSPRVLWGNVASALGGAGTMMAANGANATDLIAALLSRKPLIGTAVLHRPDRHHRRKLIRNNCCLYYRIPGGGTCGDCVLNVKQRQRQPVPGR